MSGIYIKYKLLTDEQIESGDYTRGELIDNFVPLVLSITKRFPSKYIERDEAISIGIIELIRCVDQNLNSIDSVGRFVAFVKFCVSNKIKNHCKEWYSKSVVKSPRNSVFKIITETLNDEAYSVHHFTFEIEDSINKVVRNETERVIITRVLEGGYTYADIAKETGISIAYVGKLREELLLKVAKDVL